MRPSSLPSLLPLPSSPFSWRRTAPEHGPGAHHHLGRQPEDGPRHRRRPDDRQRLQRLRVLLKVEDRVVRGASEAHQGRLPAPLVLRLRREPSQDVAQLFREDSVPEGDQKGGARRGGKGALGKGEGTGGGIGERHRICQCINSEQEGSIMRHHPALHLPRTAPQ